MSVVKNDAEKEIYVCDDGSTEDVRSALNGFDVIWVNFGDISCDKLFRFPIGINIALDMCSGDIIHYLPDDDLFFPDRLKMAEGFLKGDKKVGYGKLLYFSNENADLTLDKIRFPDKDISPTSHHPVTGLLDHSQVFHKRECILKWRIANDAPDAIFFNDLSKQHRFHPLDYYVSLKRVHPKNMLRLKESKGGIKE